MTDTATLVRLAQKRVPGSTPANLRRTVQRWCKELGFKRIGRDWWLTNEEVVEVLANIRPRPGNPSFARRA